MNWLDFLITNYKLQIMNYVLLDPSNSKEKPISL